MESNNIEQNASQIIEDDSSPINLSECVGDVSCIFLSHTISLTICIRVKLHIKYIAAIHYRF